MATDKKKLPWGKFYWSDWRSDPRLRMCSLAARGLWIDMLAIMAESDPPGYLEIDGRSIAVQVLARVIGSPEDQVEAALQELGDLGVYSTDRRGTLYSRRMINDSKKRDKARQNGRKGGNPTLCNKKGISTSDNQEVNPGLKLRGQRLEARDKKDHDAGARQIKKAIMDEWQDRMTERALVGFTGSLGEVDQWLADGCTVHDILPTIRAVIGNRPDGDLPATLQYFGKPIREARKVRLDALYRPLADRDQTSGYVPLRDRPVSVLYPDLTKSSVGSST